MSGGWGRLRMERAEREKATQNNEASGRDGTTPDNLALAILGGEEKDKSRWH